MYRNNELDGDIVVFCIGKFDSELREHDKVFSSYRSCRLIKDYKREHDAFAYNKICVNAPFHWLTIIHILTGNAVRDFSVGSGVGIRCGDGVYDREVAVLRHCQRVTRSRPELRRVVVDVRHPDRNSRHIVLRFVRYVHGYHVVIDQLTVQTADNRHRAFLAINRELVVRYSSRDVKTQVARPATCKTPKQ